MVNENESLLPAEDMDNGQNDVTDGSVENYDFDWGESTETEIEPLPLDTALIMLDEEAGKADNTNMA